MMEPDGLPVDRVAAAALVVRVIDEIDTSNDEGRDVLLVDLMCAAWGSALAQQQ
jgi:hypothetical protein